MPGRSNDNTTAKYLAVLGIGTGIILALVAAHINNSAAYSDCIDKVGLNATARVEDCNTRYDATVRDYDPDARSDFWGLLVASVLCLFCGVWCCGVAELISRSGADSRKHRSTPAPVARGTLEQQRPVTWDAAYSNLQRVVEKLNPQGAEAVCLRFKLDIERAIPEGKAGDRLRLLQEIVAIFSRQFNAEELLTAATEMAEESIKKAAAGAAAGAAESRTSVTSETRAEIDSTYQKLLEAVRSFLSREFRGVMKFAREYCSNLWEGIEDAIPEEKADDRLRLLKEILGIHNPLSVSYRLAMGEAQRAIRAATTEAVPVSSGSAAAPPHADTGAPKSDEQRGPHVAIDIGRVTREAEAFVEDEKKKLPLTAPASLMPIAGTAGIGPGATNSAKSAAGLDVPAGTVPV